MFSVRNIGLRPKALIGSFGTISFISCICAVMVFNILEVKDIIGDLTKGSSEIEDVSEVKSTYLKMDQSITEYSLSGDRRSLNTYNENVSVFNEKIRDIIKYGGDAPVFARDLGKTISSWQNEVVNPIVSASSSKVRRQLREDSVNVSSATTEQLDKQVSSFLSSRSARINSAQEEISGLINQGILVIALGLLAAFIGSAMISYVLSTTIINLFKGIFTHLDKFSTVELENLEKDFTDVIRQINGAVTGVTSSAVTVIASNDVLKSNVSKQAASVEETSASIEEISSMTQNNVTEARKMDEIAQTMQEQMRELDQAMLQIIESNETIEELSKIIRKIEEKTAIIDDIVFQTKLLSFNASVEAERAGDHGRGFAVVAQEVGNLAKMSGNAALEISNIVKDSTQKSATISVENRQRVELGNRIVKETQKQASLISEGASGLTNASNEQSVGINEINGAITIINKATIESSSIAQKNSEAGSNLKSQSDKLTRQLARLNSFLQSASKDSVPNEVELENVISLSEARPTEVDEEDTINWKTM